MAERSVVQPAVQPVKITSYPSGARIEIDEDVIGHTPLETTIGFQSSSMYIVAYPTPAQRKNAPRLNMKMKMKILLKSKPLPKHIHFDLTY